MEISASQVKELREMTGVGMMDCKKALTATNGDMEAAVKYLREKGLSKAAAKAERATKEGRIYAYIHSNSKIGVLVEVNCETDFVARTDDFANLCKDIAMHIAASSPLAVQAEDIDPKIVAEEREIYRNKALNEGKPEQIIEKIVEGQVKKFYKDNCLLEQEFVKDPDKTIQDIVTEAVTRMGENIRVARFTRYCLGE